MARGQYPRLVTNREKIFRLTGKTIPLTRKKKDGTEYVAKLRPICSECHVPVHRVYRIHAHYRKERGPRFEHVGYRCPKCEAMISRKVTSEDVEVFDGDLN